MQLTERRPRGCGNDAVRVAAAGPARPYAVVGAYEAKVLVEALTKSNGNRAGAAQRAVMSIRQFFLEVEKARGRGKF